MTDTIRWCFTHDQRYDGDASCAAFARECDTRCEVETLLSRAEWEATIEKEVEAVEVPAYEYYDGARAQVGVLYEVKATVLYPGRYGIIAVGEETP